MSCNELDLKAYALGEASASERKSVEGHAASCIPCRTELESLGTLRTAMMSWADEEPPRRIAFVSDKIFEPSLWQRWIATLNPVNLLASAALAGVVAFAMTRTGAPSIAVNQPANAPAVVSTVGPVSSPASIENVDARIAAAVKLALAESDARHKQETAQVLRAAERRLRQENERVTSQAMAFIEANYDNMKKQEARYLHASNDYGVRQ